MKSLLDAILYQDGLICDHVGWLSRFNKVSGGVNDVAIGHDYIMEGTGTNNKVAPSHGDYIISFIGVVDVGIIS